MVNGGYFEAKRLDGLRVLALAAQHGHAAVVQQLLGMGADVAVKDKKGKAGKTALYKAAENGHAAVVQQLLGMGADVAVKDKEGKTALYKAAENRHVKIVRIVLGEDEGPPDSEALLEAAKNGHSAVVRLLLEQGTSIDSRKEPTGESALYLATANGDKWYDSCSRKAQGRICQRIVD
jgi:ankyrin repeat protein